jgi:hypothetical protein
MATLTLSEARRTGRLREFVAQEEKRGIGPASQKQFDRAVKALATQRQSEDRTSRSASNGSSTGKQTR